MAIVVNLDVMLARRKMRLTELSNRVDISVTNLSNLKTGRARAIRFSTLEAICQVLDCQPGDILEFVPDGDADAGPDDSEPRPQTRRSPTATPARSSSSDRNR